MSKLTLQQENFCIEYMIDGNPSGAYLRAGFKHKESLNEDAIKLLSNPSVQARIRELHAKQAYERAKRDAKIIQELESIAFADQNSASGLPITTKEKLSALSDLAKIAGLTTDFNLALAGLRKYGLVLIPRIGEDPASNKWELLNKNTIELP